MVKGKEKLAWCPNIPEPIRPYLHTLAAYLAHDCVQTSAHTLQPLKPLYFAGDPVHGP